MMRKQRPRKWVSFVVSLTVLISLLFMTGVARSEYPEKEITMMTMADPGVTMDVLTRALVVVGTVVAGLFLVRLLAAFTQRSIMKKVDALAWILIRIFPGPISSPSCTLNRSGRFAPIHSTISS